MKFHITKEQMCKALLEFEIMVKEGRCNKMPYNTWRDLKQSLNNSLIKYFEYDGTSTTTLLRAYYGGDSYKYTFKDVPNILFILLLKYYHANSTINIKKENDTMKTPAMNFDFGPVGDNIAISPYGLAVKNKGGNWFTYDVNNSKTIDVTGFTFDFKNMIYKMPVAPKDLREGDMVLHQGKPMYITEVGATSIEAVDILDSEVKIIIPVASIFGFNFVTKIVSFLNLDTTTPSEDNPFGNLMPFMMASMVFGDNDGTNPFEDMDMGKLMMFSMMTGGQNPFANMFNFGANNN